MHDLDGGWGAGVGSCDERGGSHCVVSCVGSSKGGCDSDERGGGRGRRSLEGVSGGGSLGRGWRGSSEGGSGGGSLGCQWLDSEG